MLVLAVHVLSRRPEQSRKKGQAVRFRGLYCSGIEVVVACSARKVLESWWEGLALSLEGRRFGCKLGGVLGKVRRLSMSLWADVSELSKMRRGFDGVGVSVELDLAVISGVTRLRPMKGVCDVGCLDCEDESDLLVYNLHFGCYNIS